MAHLGIGDIDFVIRHIVPSSESSLRGNDNARLVFFVVFICAAYWKNSSHMEQLELGLTKPTAYSPDTSGMAVHIVDAASHDS